MCIEKYIILNNKITKNIYSCKWISELGLKESKKSRRKLKQWTKKQLCLVRATIQDSLGLKG